MQSLRWPGIAGHHALVTGGSRGIGRAIASQLLASGAHVTVTARTSERAAAAADELNVTGSAASGAGRAEGLGLDLSDSAGAAAVLAEFARRTKESRPVSLLVHNAGMTRDGLLMRMSLDQWQEVLTANLTGAYLVTKAVLPGMIRARRGRIVVVSSVVARMGNPGQANYAASKAGLHGFVRSLARELGSRGITVNAVAPGYVDTDMTRALPESARDNLLRLVPLGRLGQPEDVAAAVCFLLSDLAGYITGEVLDVNGGMDM
ncbi:MAG: beta-ketoacyl-ACP reductase [Acidobacteria bacterium]|nr:MAG: beta-ketoacyl-ACP reductase [Acidobacteriota bacterium]